MTDLPVGQGVFKLNVQNEIVQFPYTRIGLTVNITIRPDLYVTVCLAGRTVSINHAIVILSTQLRALVRILQKFSSSFSTITVVNSTREDVNDILADTEVSDGTIVPAGQFVVNLPINSTKQTYFQLNTAEKYHLCAVLSLIADNMLAKPNKATT